MEVIKIFSNKLIKSKDGPKYVIYQIWQIVPNFCHVKDIYIISGISTDNKGTIMPQ